MSQSSPKFQYTDGYSTIEITSDKYGGCITLEIEYDEYYEEYSHFWLSLDTEKTRELRDFLTAMLEKETE